MGKTSPVIALIIFSALTFVSIIPVHGAVTFTPEDQFAIPEDNSRFNFAIGGSYDNASLENGTWNFVGLALDNYVLDLGRSFSGGVLYGRDVLRYCSNDGNFSVSVQNCDITITNYDVITWFAPYSGWLNYTVKGVGNQTFNLHYFSPAAGRVGPDIWKVYIDGVAKPQNEGWTISRSSTDRWITVSGATSNVSIHYDKESPPKDDIDESDSNENYTGLFAIALILVIIIVPISLSALNKKRKLLSLKRLGVSHSLTNQKYTCSGNIR